MNGSGSSLEGVVRACAPRLADLRGVLTKLVADGDWTLPALEEPARQILHSGTARRGTLRGLHAQTAPFTEAKRIYCLNGRMYWVVVDLRADSGTFGRWQGHDLAEGAALAVPAGFAHGCLSLGDNVDLLIMADRDYRPGHGVGIAWNDPDLAVEWPLTAGEIRLSDEHRAYGSFAEFRRRHGSLSGAS